MRWTKETSGRCAQIARCVVLGLLLALGLGSCERDAPTEAERTVPARDSTWVADVAGFSVAVQDVRSRILPALGNGAGLEALGSALRELERTLSESDAAALETALGRAHAAARHVPVDTMLLPDRDVVCLLLEQIDAVAHAPANANRREP